MIHEFKNGLPKRDDKIYKEIEQFEYYELTNCIAYEMAIRNNQIKEAINKSIIVKSEKDYIFDDEKFDGNEKLKDVSNYLDNIIVHKDEQGEKFDYYIPLLQDHGFDYFELLEHSLLNKKSFLYTELQSHKLVDILDKEELDIVCTIERILWNSMEYTNMENDIIETNEDFLNKYLTSLEWVFAEPCEEIIKNALKRKQIIKITNKFSRPILKPKGTRLLNIDINLSLPEKELLAYISKIKDDYDKNKSMIQSPLELLGEQLEKGDANISKKKLADKFFVYDYVTARLKQIEKINQEEKLKYDEEKLLIQNNVSLIGRDKKIQIETLKHEHRENLINTTINDIFNDEELTGQIPSGTAKRYYYDIRPYIEDMKYKELITGVRTEKTS